MKNDIREEVELKKGVSAAIAESIITITGPKGKVVRGFLHPKVKVFLEGDRIIITAAKSTKREKKIIGSFQAHLKNMVKGVLEPHTYHLKICSSHFPMSVAVSGREFSVKNFLGESVPRKVTLKDNAEVKVNGSDIVVTSPDKEIAGQVAAQIETLCRITKRDRRVFQDGCYIYSIS
ncbi:MAG: 50S ribosomal protein L6 [Nanoarchaeota archaeon]